jgi:hypothetical protein
VIAAHGTASQVPNETFPDFLEELGFSPANPPQWAGKGCPALIFRITGVRFFHRGFARQSQRPSAHAADPRQRSDDGQWSARSFKTRGWAATDDS